MMKEKYDDPDETEGRRLYRLRAEKLATVQMNVSKRKVTWRRTMDEELMTLLQNTGDGIAEMFTQLGKGNWRDDHGHDVKMNKAMLNMKTVLLDIMKFRAKHLGYEPPKLKVD